MIKCKWLLLAALGAVSVSALAVTTSTTALQQGTTAQQQYALANNDPLIMGGVTWFKKVHISGLLMADSFYQSHTNYLGFSGHGAYSYSSANSSAIAAEAVLNVNAEINPWLNAYTSLFYATSNQPNGISGSSGVSSSEAVPVVDSTRYYPTVDGTSGVDVDTAFIDIGNFSAASANSIQRYFMLRLGKQYVAFGNYDRYAMMSTLTQQLEETRETAAQLSFIAPVGDNKALVSAAVYGFKGPQENSSSHSNINNGGATLGATAQVKQLKLSASAGYIFNMMSVGSIAQYNTTDTYYDRVGGWNAHVAGSWRAFTVSYDYVSALSAFDYQDLSYGSMTGAKPSAGNWTASYRFNTLGRNSQLAGSYQWSNEANSAVDRNLEYRYLSLPATRYGLEYNVELMPRTKLGVEVNYDKAYFVDQDGTDMNSWTGMVRASVVM